MTLSPLLLAKVQSAGIDRITFPIKINTQTHFDIGLTNIKEDEIRSTNRAENDIKLVFRHHNQTDWTYAKDIYTTNNFQIVHYSPFTVSHILLKMFVTNANPTNTDKCSTPSWSYSCLCQRNAVTQQWLQSMSGLYRYSNEISVTNRRMFCIKQFRGELVTHWVELQQRWRTFCPTHLTEYFSVVLVSNSMLPANWAALVLSGFNATVPKTSNQQFHSK